LRNVSYLRRNLPKSLGSTRYNQEVPICTLAFLLAFQGPTPVAEIPFEYVSEHIYMKAHVGDRQISIILDSGAAMSVLDTETGHELNVAHADSGLTTGGLGEHSVSVENLTGVKARFDGTHFELPISMAIPLRGLWPAEGRQMQAVAGYELFQKYVVDVDYIRHLIRIFNPDGYTYAGSAKELPIRIVGNRPLAKAEFNIAGLGKVNGQVLLDTGGTGIEFSQKFAVKRNFSAKVDSGPETPYGTGVGGTNSGRGVRVSSFGLGGFRIDSPTVAVSSSKDGANGMDAIADAIIGGDIFRRFHLIFDYARKRILLEPNEDFKQPPLANLTGVFLKAEGEDLRTFRVDYVVPGMAAAKAKLQAGDRIVALDGIPVSRYELWDLKLLICMARKPVSLSIERDGTAMNADLNP